MNLNVSTKSRLCESIIRPVMTYTVETWPDVSKTKRILNTAEMKIFCKQYGKTVYDGERSEDKIMSTWR